MKLPTQTLSPNRELNMLLTPFLNPDPYPQLKKQNLIIYQQTELVFSLMMQLSIPVNIQLIPTKLLFLSLHNLARLLLKQTPLRMIIPLVKQMNQVFSKQAILSTPLHSFSQTCPSLYVIVQWPK